MAYTPLLCAEAGETDGCSEGGDEMWEEREEMCEERDEV